MKVSYSRIFLTVLVFLAIFLRCAFAEEVLSWQDCLKEASKNHPDLVAAEEQVKQSEDSKKIAASALYPQIDGSLSASNSKNSGASLTKTYAYGAAATQLLFDGAKKSNDIKASAESLLVSKQQFRFVSVNVRLRLRQAFIHLLKAQGMQRITEEIFSIRRQNFELITLRYQSGLEHKGALLTAEADLANAKYNISQTKRSISTAQRELAKEMGRETLILFAVQGDYEVKESAEDKPVFESLAASNPQVQQVVFRKAAAQFNLKSAYANFYPSIIGQANANKTASSWPPQKERWDVGLVLSLPLFEGGLRKAQVSQAKEVLSQLEANQRSIKDSVILSLEETWAALQDAIENVEVQKKSLAAAEERSRIAQAQYSTGFISFDSWIIIENNLVAAKVAVLNAEADALLAEANWIQAKGETLEYE